MDDKIAQLILDELFSSLENLETQTAAVRQFLKDKGGATDELLAPYLEQAGKSHEHYRRSRKGRQDGSAIREESQTGRKGEEEERSGKSAAKSAD